MGNKKKSESGFLVQGSILAIASIISRIIGLLYRVPLTAIIGNNGNSYYSCAYEIYSMLLLISSYSLPMAVSKLVSARVAKGDFKNAFKVFKGAFLFAVCSGIVAMLIVFFGAEMITRLMKTPLSIFALKVLAPTLVVMAVLGVMRGFFQGLGTMMPSAVSQIIEQIINAIVSVWAAYLLADYGNKVGAVLGNGEDYAAAYGAAGGTLGTALGAVFALLFSIFVFATYVPVFKNRMNNSRTKKNESYGSIMRILIMTIVPVLLSTTIYNISSVIDQGIYKNVALLQGSTNRQMDELWGIFSGKYKVLINVPISIASAMAASAAVELLGGTPLQCTYAASTVLMNMLGLVCDPVGGLVEYPCQNRNAAGVSNALIAAEMSLAGIPQFIPLDEMIDAMYTVGKKLPAELRETALGGCAATPSACEKCHLCS